MSSLLLRLRSRLGGSLSPLFVGGGHGVWFDAADPTTMWQDTAKTIPVRASGDPVRVWRDKINGFEAVAPSDAARPVWTRLGGLAWLAFNGSSSTLITSASVTAGGATSVLVAAGAATVAATGTYGVVVEHSTSTTTNNGAFVNILAPPGANNSFSWSSKGTTAVVIGNLQDAAPPAGPRVLLGEANIATPTTSLTQNGGTPETSTSSQGTGTYADLVMHIGSRGGVAGFASLRLFGLVVKFAPAAGEAAIMQRIMAQRSGLSLNA